MNAGVTERAWDYQTNHAY